jgi:hypothetical protein
MTMQTQAARLDAIAEDAAKLADHARVAATHFRNKEVPRAAAHILAAEGHLVAIRAELDIVAREHAENSRPVI